MYQTLSNLKTKLFRKRSKTNGQRTNYTAQNWYIQIKAKTSVNSGKYARDIGRRASGTPFGEDQVYFKGEEHI